MTACQPTKSYNSIRLDGPISVKQVPAPHPHDSFTILLLGPTGSGKSSFIEALAPKGSLQISSPGLEGFTQLIATYRVENMTSLVYSGQAIYIIDVPGFGDTKISEMSIVSMIKEWMGRMRIFEFGRILYFTPINVVRLPGSQRRMLKTFQTLTGIQAAKNVVIVSTMWDQLSGESSMQRAQRNFEQLQDVVWKDFIQNGCLIVKFDNNPESTLSILDDACQDLVPQTFHIEEVYQMRYAAFGADLYSNLQLRIQNLQIERANVQSELEGARLCSDSQLITIFSSQLAETERLIAKFNQELEDFDPPPSSSVEDIDALSAFDYQPADAVTSRPVEAVSSPHPGSHEATLSSRPTVAKRGTFARLFSSLKCWGQEVHEHHDL